MRWTSFVCTVFILAGLSAGAAERPEPDRELVFKSFGDKPLKLHIFEPPGGAPRPAPAIVFFFGGGWQGGSPSQFYSQARHLADLGVWACSAEYRVKSRDNVSPYDCVKDGRSAVRFLRAHAKELRIDPERVAAGGGSAGGHVAVCAGLLRDYDHPDEDPRVSGRPDLLVLFNPVLDTSPTGFAHHRLGPRYDEINPLSHAGAHAPPTLVMVGTEDPILPLPTARIFQSRMKAVGADCQLKTYPDQKHGFFNWRPEGNPYYDQTLAEMEDFLKAHGWLTQ